VSSGPSGTVDPSGTSVPATEEYSVAALLGALPVVEDRGRFTISTGSFDAAARLGGLTRPAPGATDEEVRAFQSAVTGYVGPTKPATTVAALVPEMQQNGFDPELQPDFAKAVGWSITDVDDFVSDVEPPNTFSVLDGTFDTGAIDAAMGPKKDGIWAQPGEDLRTSLDTKNAADRLGRPVRMAGDGTRIAFGLTTARMTGWANGTGPTMADDAAAMQVAAVLDDADVYSAYLLRGVSGPPPFNVLRTDGPGSSSGTADELLLPTYFDTVGVGLTVVDGKPKAVLVYHHADEKSATENVEAITEIAQSGKFFRDNALVSTRLTLDGVVATGTTSVATFSFTEGTGPNFLWQLVLTADVLVVHA